MNNTWKLCQTQRCRELGYLCTQLFRSNFELRCGECISPEDRRLFYLEIAQIKKPIKEQLKLAQQQMKSNQEQQIKEINRHFEGIIENICQIRNKMITCIKDFALPQWVIKFSNQQQPYEKELQELHQIIQDYFQIEENSTQPEMTQYLKNNINFPTVINQKLLEFLQQIQNFNNKLLDSIKEADKNILNQQRNEQNQRQQQLISNYLNIHRPLVVQTQIKIMNDGDSTIEQLKDIKFTLKPKQQIKLVGFKFGQGTDSEEINLIIKQENEEIFQNNYLIIGEKNKQVQFSQQLLEAGKEYIIQIKKGYEISVVVFKQNIENDFVEILGENIPIEGLLVAN